MVILKGASGKAKRVLVEEILSSGPYLIVQTLGVSRDVYVKCLDNKSK